MLLCVKFAGTSASREDCAGATLSMRLTERLNIGPLRMPVCCAFVIDRSKKVGTTFVSSGLRACFARLSASNCSCAAISLVYSDQYCVFPLGAGFVAGAANFWLIL